MMNNELKSFDEAVSQFVLDDPSYPPEAYYFLRDGFEYVLRAAERKCEDNGRKRRTGGDSQLSGRELAEGLREFALNEYGPMAFFTLAQWNIHKTSDFGELVYNLIKMGKFCQNKGDKKSDFDDIYDFDEAFNDPFRA